MSTAILLTLLVAVLGSEPVVLVEYYSNGCAKCQAMKSTLDELRSEGIRVRRVDVDEYPRSAAKHHVKSLPCYFVLVDREVTRIHEGTATKQELLTLLKDYGTSPSTKATQPPRQLQESKQQISRNRVTLPPLSNDNSRQLERPTTSHSGFKLTADARKKIRRATVRLGVFANNRGDYGSGTIIARRGSKALIATCAHIFRDASLDVPIRVTFFSDTGEKYLRGRAISWDAIADVGLVVADGVGDVEPLPIATPQSDLQVQDLIAVAGCDLAGEPVIEVTDVRQVNRYPDGNNLAVGATPPNGRSGGGAFNRNFELIGSCIGVLPSSQNGIYAGLDSIWNQFDKVIKDGEASWQLRRARQPAHVLIK